MLKGKASSGSNGLPELSKKKRGLRGWPGFVSSCVAAVCLFEMDASTVKNLMPGTYTTVKNANCQVLTLHKPAFHFSHPTFCPSPSQRLSKIILC